MKFINRISALFSISALLLLTLTSNSATAQKGPVAGKSASVQVLQFHLEHRCVTCRRIETQTKATLGKYFSNVPFRLVNVEDVKNEKLTKEFQATGTSLYLFDHQTGKKKNLTEFAFLTAGNELKFEKDLKTQIENFLKN